MLRSYAQTPLYPIMSPLVTEKDLKTEVSETVHATIQGTLKSQTEIQRNNVLNYWTSGKSEKSTSPSVLNTSTQTSTLKSLLSQVLGNSVSNNSSRWTQMRKSLNYQESAKVTSNVNADVYKMVQDWQQNYLDYLNNM